MFNGFNHHVLATTVSPITEAYSWLQGVDRGALIDVSQAVPGYSPPEEMLEHLALKLRDPETCRYTDQLGLPDLRAALADDIGEVYGTRPDVDQVAIVAGANQAFCLAVSTLAAPGDEVVLTLPYYFNHEMWLRAMGIVPVLVASSADQLPDPESLAAALTPRTKAIVLISPNNPTGAVCPPDRLLRCYEVAQQARTALILDETYRDFRADPVAPHALFAQPDWAQTLVHLYSFSKVFAMTGYRVGALVASREILEGAAKLMDCVAICPPHPGQIAALFGLRHLGEWREANRRRMGARLDLFRNELSSSGAPFRLASAGAYFAYLQHQEQEDSRAVARRLVTERGVLCLAGSMFGPGQRSFLRLAFANLNQKTIPELVARLAAPFTVRDE